MIPAHTWFAPRIQQPSTVRRDLFDLGRTQGPSRIGAGDLVLFNGDGALDVLLDYGWDGQPLTVWIGWPGGVVDTAPVFLVAATVWDPSISATRVLYWGTKGYVVGTAAVADPVGFTKVLVGAMQQCFVDFLTVTIRIRDRQPELMIALQPTKYAGDNVLPAGLEGTAVDLMGKPKPICYGKALNVPAVCVNTSKLIYQVHDGAIASLEAVYDRGIYLGIGMKWVSQTSGFGASVIWAIAYGNGLYVAVGASGKLYTSPDGVTWTVRTSGFGASAIRSVGYGNGLFVAGGAGGLLATSPDGITWTLRTSNMGAQDINGVAYGAGVYVIVGNSHQIATSPDGVTWTNRTSSWASDDHTGITFANGQFVTVGTNRAVETSPTGTTWTDRSVGGSLQPFMSVTYGAGIYVAVGGSGTLFTSPDAITWTDRSGVFGGNDVNSVAYGNGLFVAVGTNGVFATSQDGLVWSLRTSVFAASSAQGVVYGNLLWIAVGASGNLATTTPPGTYASLADLQDDTLAPVVGTYKVYLAGGYFRLGAIPAGLVTADVTEGATAADRTAAQIFKRALIRAGKSAGDYDAGDLTALDAANAAVLGFWTNEETTVAALLDQVAGSVWAWWGIDRTGVFGIQQFTAPSGTPVVAFNANHIIGQPSRIPSADPDGGIPVWRTIVRHSRVYATQDTDLAGGVTAERRNLVAKEWREALDEDATVQLAHLLAPQTVEDSLLTSEADAQAEATRRLVVRSSRWDLFEILVELNAATVLIDLGSIVSLTHDRFNLMAGQLFKVIGLEPNGAERTLSLTLWGVAGGVAYWGYLTKVSGDFWTFSRDIADREGQLVLSGADVLVNDDPLVDGLQIDIAADQSVELATV